jgi:hypothetical protein
MRRPSSLLKTVTFGIFTGLFGTTPLHSSLAAQKNVSPENHPVSPAITAGVDNSPDSDEVSRKPSDETEPSPRRAAIRVFPIETKNE